MGGLYSLHSQKMENQKKQYVTSIQHNTDHLVKTLLHQFSAIAALHQRAFGGNGRSTKAQEALRCAVSQQAQQSVGLWRLHRLEAGEGSDVTRLGAETHQLLTVFIMNHLLLRDLLHLLSHPLMKTEFKNTMQRQEIHKKQQKEGCMNG